MAGRPPPPSLSTTLIGDDDGDAGTRARVRRRPRASKRAPVTVLNTDPSNFRAMVQQFTGIPAPPFPSGGEPFISFGAVAGFRDPNITQIQHRSQAQPMSIGGGQREAFLRALDNSQMSLGMADGFLLDSMSGDGGYFFS